MFCAIIVFCIVVLVNQGRLSQCVCRCFLNTAPRVSSAFGAGRITFCEHLGARPQRDLTRHQPSLPNVVVASALPHPLRIRRGHAAKRATSAEERRSAGFNFHPSVRSRHPAALFN